MDLDLIPSYKEAKTGLDMDDHGCIGSAGYVWCEEKKKCIRSWEENCYAEDENQVRFLLSLKRGIPMERMILRTEQKSDSHMRGKYQDISEEETKMNIFLAAKIGGLWIIACDNSDDAIKEKLEKYDFPSRMLDVIASSENQSG